MATKLDKPIRRELEVDGEAYTITISPEGVRVTRKGHRKGHELSWRSIITGDAELAQQLRISVDATSTSARGGGG